MRAYGQKLVKFCTLTHAAKLVVRILLGMKIHLQSIYMYIEGRTCKFN